MKGILDAEGAAALRTAIHALDLPADAEDHRTAPQRRADALVELCHLAFGSGQLPTVSGERPHLNILVPWTTITRGAATHAAAANGDGSANGVGRANGAGSARANSHGSGERANGQSPPGTGPPQTSPRDNQPTAPTAAPGPAEAERPGSGLIDVRRTGTGLIEAGPAGTGLIDAGVPEAGAPEAGAPEAGAPEAGAPEVRRAPSGLIVVEHAPTGPTIATGSEAGSGAGGLQAGGLQAGGLQAGGLQAGGLQVGGLEVGGFEVGVPGGAIAELAFTGPIDAETARRLACDAGVARIITDPNGLPIELGRRTRTVPAHLRRALAARDKGCLYPGCDRPPERCEAHHFWHWLDGGPTNLNNTGLACTPHHHWIHDGRWTPTPPVRARSPLPRGA